MAAERHEVPSGDGRLALVLHLPGGRGRVPWVAACHGLGASKDSDKYLLLGARLPAAGLGLARFDFRGSGESTGSGTDTTVATRVADVHAVLAALSWHPRLEGGVGLLGSSLGGYVALLVAHERADGLPVVTWNAPADLRRLATEPDLAAFGLGEPFARELASGRYLEAPAGVRGHLTIQAETDEVVPAVHGTRLHARAAEPRALVTIAGADHRLTDPEHRWRAVEHSLDWLLRWLAPEEAATRGAAPRG